MVPFVLVRYVRELDPAEMHTSQLSHLCKLILDWRASTSELPLVLYCVVHQGSKFLGGQLT